MSYTPSFGHKRSAAERIDQRLAWDRSDEAFFAAGACHILAYAFHDLHADEGYEIIFVKPPSADGMHVYVTDGVWAFDFNGWTREEELLKMTKLAEQKANPTWEYDRHVITDDLETFCRKNNHRAPAYFFHLPWERAYSFIDQFESEPPSS
jgi:hypothetical protein